MRPNGTLRPKVRTAVCPHPEEADMDPAKEVKPYVKRNKNDPADAEAICEAVRRPTMRFVGGEVGRAAGPADAASHTRPADTATNAGDQCLAGAFG